MGDQRHKREAWDL